MKPLLDIKGEKMKLNKLANKKYPPMKINENREVNKPMTERLKVMNYNYWRVLQFEFLELL